MKKKVLFTSIVLLAITVFIALSVNAAGSFRPVLVLEAESGYLDGPAEVRGEKVGNIGYCGGPSEGTITFYDLEVPEDGVYTMCVYYYSGSDDRYFVFTVDGVETQLDCPSTGSFDTVGTILLDIELKKGATMKIGTDWYGPDLDKIEFYKKGAFDFVDREYTDTDNSTEHVGKYVLMFDKNNGVYSVGKNTGGKDISVIVENAHSEFILNDKIISSDDFDNHSYSSMSDKKGFIFEHTGHSDFDGKLVEEFVFDKNLEYFTVKVKIVSDKKISTNYISAMSVYSDCINIEDGIFIKMPFDNDKWEEPKFIQQLDLGHSTTSYEVAAYFSQTTDMSLVCGSLSHDIWKSAVSINAEDGIIKGFDLFAGVSNSGTRDKYAHGFVEGKEIQSPLMFVGITEDWKQGFELYGKANAEVVAPKTSVKDVPFGFNSWGSLGTGVGYGDMNGVSNYIKNHLQKEWSIDESPVYVNIDSFWDYIHLNDIQCDLTLDEALAAFVKNCHDNGQKAGIYFTPFACWLSDETEMKNKKMEGSDYTFYDAALRSPDGTSIYGKLDDGYALDPTHPGTIARIEDRFNYFIDLGFEYIKLDFTTHGALEGNHYLDEITTGIQAYNYGMKKIHDICNGKMFVNLSISPIFPYQYADGRRISCDAFASIDNTRHVLSYLTTCFWQKSLYAYPDPDHLIVTGVDENVARVRVTSGAISGTSFIVGDNLSAIKTDSSDHQRILKMYGNKDIIELAKLGIMFKPTSNIVFDKCADTYYAVKDNYLYVAMFNFDYSKEIVFNLMDLVDDAALIPSSAKELWSGNTYEISGGHITFDLSSNDTVIFKISLSNNDVTPTPDNTLIETDIPETTVVDTETPNTTVIDTEMPDTTIIDTTPEASTTEDTNTPETLDKNENKESNKTGIIIAIIVVIVVVAVGTALFIIKKKK